MQFRLIKLLIILFISIGLYGCHVGRFFLYNFANLDDYKKFPASEINIGNQVFHFKEKIDTSVLFNNFTMDSYTSVNTFNSKLEDSKTVSFLIIYKDTIRYEWYADNWNDESVVSSFSMSKSVVSALVGLALHEGYIDSLNEPITNYLSFKRDGFNKITIQHLLDMRTGIDYDENYYNPFGNVAVGYYGRDLKKHVYNLKIKKEPGKSFEYISIATQMLGMIVSEATGKSVSQYMQEKIWTKIGAEHPASWSLDKKKGIEKSFCCINSTAKDFAKFGRLYLMDGQFDNNQVIPKSWVENSVQISSNTEDNFYQNQWWLFGPSDRNDPGTVTYVAQGHLGQFLYIDPNRDLIIVRFGKQYGGIRWINLFKDLSMSYRLN